MTSLRFLQFSDLHIGRGFRGPPFTLSDEERETLRSDRETVLKNIAERGGAREVDLVLIPGDLFEDRRLREREARVVREVIERFHPVPVVIAPGNRDFYDQLSWYHPDVLEQHGIDRWPENLHLFTSDQFETIRVDSIDGLRVTGIAHRSAEARDERLLQENVVRERGDLNLFMLHGSIVRSPGGGSGTPLPATRRELLNQDAEYVALGHRHEERLLREDGFVRAANAGAPMAVSLDDTGNRSVMFGTLTEDGVDSQSVERVRVCSRNVHDLEWTAGEEESGEDLCRRLDGLFEERGVDEKDLVRLRWTGERPSPSLLQSDAFKSFKDRYFHLHVDAGHVSGRLDPASLDDEASPERTSEGRFVRAMKERMEDATSDERREIAEKAFRIGLEAFHNEEVDLDHVL